jgi:hypothetical protein
MHKFYLRAARLLAILATSITAAYGCDCDEPTVKDAAKMATVIFRGTITALKPSGKPYTFRRPSGTEKIAVFRVTRVWKGEVSRTFEMPAVLEEPDCLGFAPQFVKPGAELVVYAFRMDGVFITGICTRTRFVRYASEDFKDLGPGWEPK